MIYYVGTAYNKQVVNVRLDAIGTYPSGKPQNTEEENPDIKQGELMQQSGFNNHISYKKWLTSYEECDSNKHCQRTKVRVAGKNASCISAYCRV